jgi:hypothetical protein
MHEVPPIFDVLVAEQVQVLDVIASKNEEVSIQADKDKILIFLCGVLMQIYNHCDSIYDEVAVCHL